MKALAYHDTEQFRYIADYDDTQSLDGQGVLYNYADYNAKETSGGVYLVAKTKIHKFRLGRQDEVMLKKTATDEPTFYTNFNSFFNKVTQLLATTSTEGALHWVAVETESTADYIFKGGLNGTAWQINRYDRNNNMERTAATEVDNSAYNTLETAWENRTALNYS